MAKDKDTETQAAGEPAGRTEAAGGAQQPGGQTGQQAQITIDDSSIQAHYANFCRVSSTPEELVLDLGLNPQPYATGPQTIRVSQRIILNHFTAKRLLSALSMALQRHEQAFGVLETDIRKRVRST